MRLVLGELCGLLENQKSILTDLLKLTREEQRVIISGESGKLESLVRQELKELSKLGAIEKKRAELNKDIAKEMNLKQGGITVSAIADGARPDEREALRKLQAELTALIEEHKHVNKQNRELIKSHMEYSGAMLELMSEPDDPLNNFYSGDGSTTSERRKTTGFYSGQA